MFDGHNVELWLGGLGHLLEEDSVNVRLYDVIIDCLGDDVKREINAEMLATHVWPLLVSWNHVPSRLGQLRAATNVLREVMGNHAPRRPLKVFFFCKKGERRSAAVLAVILCCLFGFSPPSAKKHIEVLRTGATLTKNEERSPWPGTYLDVIAAVGTIGDPYGYY